MDLKNWMTILEDDIRNVPVIYLAIPGSHDSMTYTINSHSKISPDSLAIARILVKLFGQLAKNVVIRWSVTQSLPVTNQLNCGIRYFDVRLSTAKDDPKLYIVHGLYGAPIEDLLNEINNFLNENKDEIVILDFQHFYEFTKDDHVRLLKSIETIFNDKLCPLPWDINSVTLAWMADNRYQAIVVYRNNTAEGNNNFWPSVRWPTPWPATTKIAELLPYLEMIISKRIRNAGLVTQCLLTPDYGFVIRNIFSNLKSSCAIPCMHAVIPWLSRQRPGNHGINVVIADFIEEDNTEFCRTVISLNDKLLKNHRKV